ncbi:hypothetical protein SAMN05446635_0623 [Burkholderia sp. OK233]|nr:hypothetical protein SAMN05446635_0623 [Burkholderia sp. OK233]
MRFHTYETARVLFPIKLEGNEGWGDGTSHAPKVHILSGQMVVEFAGEPRLACGLIAELKSDIEARPNRYEGHRDAVTRAGKQLHMRHCSHLDLEVAMHRAFDVAKDELADWPDQVIES